MRPEREAVPWEGPEAMLYVSELEVVSMSVADSELFEVPSSFTMIAALVAVGPSFTAFITMVIVAPAEARPSLTFTRRVVEPLQLEVGV